MTVDSFLTLANTYSRSLSVLLNATPFYLVFASSSAYPAMFRFRAEWTGAILFDVDFNYTLTNNLNALTL